MQTSLPIMSFSFSDSLNAILRGVEDFPDSIKKDLSRDLLLVIDEMHEASRGDDFLVKLDFYDRFLPKIRSAVVRAEKALRESDMPLNRLKNKEELNKKQGGDPPGGEG